MSTSLPRLLDLRDRHRVKVTSHMVGRAAELEPALAREVVGEFIAYAQRQPGVVFMRKDEIARFALSQADTPRAG